MKPSEYQHIKVWGQMMSSFEYFIASEQMKATKDNAPLDAIYQCQDGTWRRFSECTNQNTVDYFAKRGLKQDA
jgi:hypothetical protein